jgi:hypothetical protein
MSHFTSSGRHNDVLLENEHQSNLQENHFWSTPWLHELFLCNPTKYTYEHILLIEVVHDHVKAASHVGR